MAVPVSQAWTVATYVLKQRLKGRKKLSNLLDTDDGRRAEHLTPAEWVELWRSVEAER